MSSWDVPPNAIRFIDNQWDQIHGWCSEDKRDWMRETVSVCEGDAVDIGVWGGKSSLALACGMNNGRILWTIDPYSVKAAGIERSGSGEGFEEWNSDWRYTEVRSHWLTRLMNSGLLSRVRMLEVTDEKACLLFEDESLGFIHVDGNHGEVSQRETTIRWLKKLRKGGILCQDDTNWDSVVAGGAVEAVDRVGDRIREDATPEKKWVAWRKR